VSVLGPPLEPQGGLWDQSPCEQAETATGCAPDPAGGPDALDGIILMLKPMVYLDEKLLRDDPMLSEIVRNLASEFHPERIYLFGSKARGDSGADSDYDLVMVIAKPEEPRYRIAQRALDLLWDLGTAVDILVWSLESFEARAEVVASLPATVLREGKLLYAA